MSEVIFALTKRSPRFWLRLNTKIGGGGGWGTREDITEIVVIRYQVPGTLVSFRLGLYMIILKIGLQNLK